MNKRTTEYWKFLHQSIDKLEKKVLEIGMFFKCKHKAEFFK